MADCKTSKRIYQKSIKLSIYQYLNAMVALKIVLERGRIVDRISYMLAIRDLEPNGYNALKIRHRSAVCESGSLRSTALTSPIVSTCSSATPSR
jgi:hypothetical protein